MAIPDYLSQMLPVLKLASDGKEHKLSSAAETSADELGFGADQSSLISLITAGFCCRAGGIVLKRALTLLTGMLTT